MRNRPFRGNCAAGCGEPVFSASAKAKFCSVACAKLRFELHRGTCAHCGEKLRRRQYKYCSLKCAHLDAFRSRCARLEEGAHSTYTTNHFIRRYLVHRYGEKCSRCGWAERHPTTGRVPVEVEHIDGNWRNNAESNLTLLCPNCHSLTDTFRGLNRGRGRPLRLGGRANPLVREEGFKDSDTGRPN